MKKRIIKKKIEALVWSKEKIISTLFDSLNWEWIGLNANCRKRIQYLK